jgi:hypothetical protein
LHLIAAACCTKQKKSGNISCMSRGPGVVFLLPALTRSSVQQSKHEMGKKERGFFCFCLGKKKFFTTPFLNLNPHYWFSPHRNAASQRGGGEGSRLQSQGGQDLCAAAAAEHLIFTTSPEEQTVDLTNKVTTKDSQRFSRWFHSAWRTTGAVGL